MRTGKATALGVGLTWVGPGLAPAAPDLTGGTGGVEVGLLTT